MLTVCIKAEHLKLKRSFIWIAFFLLPLIPALMGSQNYLNNLGVLSAEWYSLWTQESLFYSNFFFAPMIAIYCGYLWRVENFGHNRNALLTYPVPVRNIFLGKMAAAFSVSILTQVWMFFLFLVTGKAVGLTGLPPAPIFFWMLRGTLAALAITALQTLLAMVIRSFALPVGLSAVGSILGLVAVNSEKAFLYPYSLLILGMNANRDTDMVDSGILFFASSLFYLILFAFLGIWILKKADVKA